MRITTLFNRLLRLEGVRVKDVQVDDDSIVLSIGRTFRALQCPRCGRSERARFSRSFRRWRHMAIWVREVWLEGEIRRLRCRGCDVVVTEAVPWARHGSCFTRPFEDAVAMFAQQTDQTAVAELTGIAWPTVGSICECVVQDYRPDGRLRDLRRIGVDEISFRKRHRYLTVVSDHDSGRVVWTSEGKSSETLESFFRELGAEASARIEIVTMDMSAAYERAVRNALPNAAIAFDHFHIVKLANEALNAVRRELVRQAPVEERKPIKNSMWPLLRRSENATERDVAVLEKIRPASKIGRAYLLKEGLLDVLRKTSRQSLGEWLAWAARCRISPFVKLGKTIRSHIEGVKAMMRERLTNGLAEGLNNNIRLLSHRAFGFHSAGALIAMIEQCCSGIELPHLQAI